MTIHLYKHASDLIAFKTSSLYDGFPKEQLELHNVDIHLVVFDKQEAVARCSLWWQATPAYLGHKLGLIGHYAAKTDAAAKKLLEFATSHLKEQGCTLAVGPMDGSTWRNYRFVTQGDAPPFFLEPSNPAAYPRQWQAAGFGVLANYLSALQSTIPNFPDLEKRLEGLAEKGIQIRTLNQENLSEDLEAIYHLSLKSFTNNFLYGSLDKTEFMAQYQHVLPFIRPELILLAEQNGKLLSFMFALADLSQTQRAQVVDTFIIKTIATDPELMGQGLAGTLTQLVMQKAQTLGFKKVIHALIYSNNASLNLSRKYAQTPLRRYAVFSKSL